MADSEKPVPKTKKGGMKKAPTSTPIKGNNSRRDPKPGRVADPKVPKGTGGGSIHKGDLPA
jgi:hypothetical protein